MLSLMGTANAQNVNIPDTDLKAALLSHDPVIDTNDDGEIQVGEAEAFTGMLNLRSKSISDATGLEAFVNLTKLEIGSNQLTELDISANTALTTVFCAFNSITTLDLSQNTLLDTLGVQGNDLTSLDVRNNTALQSLFFSNNEISNFQFPANFSTTLKALWYGGNPISNTFDFTQFAGLEVLECSSSGLTTLDISSMANLRQLFCGSNPLTSLDLTQNPELLILVSNNNPGLDIAFASNPKLEVLNVFSSEISALDVSMLPHLQGLACFDNPITNLDLSQNQALQAVIFGNTWIRNIDLSNNPNLNTINANNTTFYETEGRLETINLANGNNEAIQDFRIRDNPLLYCVAVDNPADPFPNIIISQLDGFSAFSSQCVEEALQFADPSFEGALLAHDPPIDQNADGFITETEAGDFVGFLDLENQSIKNVRELKFFSGITGIDLSRNRIGNIDLSNSPNLTTLDVSYNNELTVLSLDNGNNTAITSFVAAGTMIQLNCITVDDPVYSQTNWTDIASKYDFSTDCDVELHSSFKSLLLADGYDLNADGEIQVSEAEAITGELDYYDNNVLLGLGLEAMINVTGLNLGDPQGNQGITTANFTQNARLKTLYLNGNRLPSIDLSCNPSLQIFYAIDGVRTDFNTLDLSNNHAIKEVQIGSSHFTELNVSNARSLRTLGCSSNNLERLDLRDNVELFFFNARYNNLNWLNIQSDNNENISALSFDIRNNPDLTCVTVDDPDYAEANFTNVDAGVRFDLDCDDTPIAFADANLENALLNYSPAIDLNDDGEIRLSEAVTFTGVLNLVGLNIFTAGELNYFTSLTGLDISNNQLTVLNIRNGNNTNFTLFDARGNAGLTCIKVDNAAYSTQNWTNIDAGSSFSAYCDLDEIVDIPDPLLKGILLGTVDGQVIDTNDDDEISYGEALAFTGNLDIDVSNNNIADATGVEAFENITGFESGGYNTFTELDLSVFSGLINLDIERGGNGGLPSIDISNNSLLETINISNLPVIGLEGKSNLTELNCQTCSLASIDLSQSSSLTSLYLFENNIQNLDLSFNIQLEVLSLREDNLESIDLSSNAQLKTLSIRGDIQSIDFSALTELERLNLTSRLTTIDLSNQAKLEFMQIDLPQFQSIDLSNNLLLETVFLTGNSDTGEESRLENITFGENTRIHDLAIFGHKLRSLDLSFMDFERFRFANVSFNSLEEINIGKISGINLRGNPSLTCAQTTDIAYAEANYIYDEGLFFSTDICAAPTDITLSSTSFDENATTAIGTFTTTDESTSNVHTYSFFEDGTENSNALFDIVDDQIFPVSPFNFESESETNYLIQVQSDDGFGGILKKRITITLNDVNEAPTLINLSNSSIDESRAPGTVIGILSVEDEDDGDTHTYEVFENVCITCRTSQEDEFQFVIVGNELRSNVVLDFETQEGYEIAIEVTDAGGLSNSREFTISINDLPPQVTSIELSNASVNENEDAGILVGSLETFGEDLSGSFSYDLVSGEGDTDNEAFSINSNQLLTTTSFDFETKSSYSIRIMTDDGTLTGEEVLIITVTDVAEAPTDLGLSSATITENNAIGDVVGTLSSTDEDTGETFTYSLVSGTGDDDNASFNIVNDELISLVVFDFETKSSYSVRIETNDGNGGTFQKIFTISIINQNESISVIEPLEDVEEIEGFGSIAVNLSGVFEDVDGDALTYSASSSNTSVVTVNNSGAILTITEVGVGTSNITVTADDNSGSTTSNQFMITVTQVPLGFEDELDIQVYPNPAGDFVNIESNSKLTIQLIDLNGRLIKVDEGQKVRMDLRALVSGSYLLQLTDGTSTTKRRIIKAN